MINKISVISFRMIQKAIFLLLNVFILGLISGSNTFNVSEVDQCVSFVVKGNDFYRDSNRAFIDNAYLDSYDPKYILSEISNEDDPSDIPLFKTSPIPTLSFCNHHTSRDGSFKIKLKIYGLLERNMPPVHNVSRCILYHSLQINS